MILSVTWGGTWIIIVPDSGGHGTHVGRDYERESTNGDRISWDQRNERKTVDRKSVERWMISFHCPFLLRFQVLSTTFYPIHYMMSIENEKVWCVCVLMSGKMGTTTWGSIKEGLISSPDNEMKYHIKWTDMTINLVTGSLVTLNMIRTSEEYDLRKRWKWEKRRSESLSDVQI